MLGDEVNNTIGDGALLFNSYPRKPVINYITAIKMSILWINYTLISLKNYTLYTLDSLDTREHM